MRITQKITPFLSFSHQAEEAAAFYVSVIPDSKILRMIKNPDNGAVMLVEFELAGLQFEALNVGETWEFTHAFSLSVACETQEEIDALWSQLSAGGKEVACGWLTDKFGVSWQIVPTQICEWLSHPDPAKAARVLDAVRQMTKLDLGKLKQAYEAE